MLLSACQSGVSPTGEVTGESTDTFSPTATNTPTPTNNDIYEIKPSKTRLTQTALLTPTNKDFYEIEIFTPLNVDLSSFEEKGIEGNIWVFQRSNPNKELSLLSLNKMMIAEGIQIPGQCIGMIPWESSVICTDKEELFQYNLNNNQEIDLNFKLNNMSKGNIFGSHTEFSSTVPGDYEFIYINNETGEVIRFTLGDEDMLGIPQISNNGRFIAHVEFGSEGYQLAILDNETLESQIVSTPDHNLTTLFLWSPDDRFLLFGGTSYVSQYAGLSNQLYIYDREIDEAYLLIEAPEGSEFSDWVSIFSVSIWSPDSKYVAVVLQSNPQSDSTACIIQLRNSEQVCYSIKVLSLVWSPDSKFIAFFSYDRELTYTSINILDIESGEMIQIYESENLEHNTLVNWTD
jgi:hypothetical protein